ncbi:hypothetical protein BS47DRAFT_1366197 [Hydnum rufescens UP504]|uniref:Ubiquitin-like protease family profile domain-containing protein n=1 Tax=Hydnum rufescens UP504 TaxID=1448309 RepID=A0A9P6AMG3_9AGAM|nr:hypothetical protein BS47DRAFT_1366197 [Hydnum rufescens UP504]
MTPLLRMLRRPLERCIIPVRVSNSAVAMIQWFKIPPAGDAVIPSGVLHHPCKDQELVSSALPTWNVVSLSTLLVTWELLESSAEHTYHRTLDLLKTTHCPIKEYPDLFLLTLASVEISDEIISNSEWPHFFQQPWCLTYSNSRRSFQYIDQLPDADPNMPGPDDLVPQGACFYLKESYLNPLANFVHSASTLAWGWHSQMQRNGLHVPVPLPSCKHHGGDVQYHFKYSYVTKVRIMVDVEIFLQYGYLCRGYAQWLMRKFVACLSQEVGMPCPHFGVDNKLIGAVFCEDDMEDSCVFGVIRGLERDGVPVFVVSVFVPWLETVWDRVGCAKIPWENPTNVTPAPGDNFLPISVEYVPPVEHPFPWFSAPSHGYPGDYSQSRGWGRKLCYEEQALLETLMAATPQCPFIPLMMKSYKVVAKFLESAQVNPPLDPLLTTLALGDLAACHLYSDLPQIVLMSIQNVANRKYGQKPWPHHLPSPEGLSMLQNHWAVVSIDFKRCIVTYLDSIFWLPNFEFIKMIVAKYLADLAAHKSCSFDLEAWTFVGSEETSPQQTGVIDCGVLVMANLRNCAGIQPWKVLCPTEVVAARVQFTVDTIQGVIDYPRQHDSVLESIFPSCRPPALILPNESNYIPADMTSIAPSSVQREDSWLDAESSRHGSCLNTVDAGEQSAMEMKFSSISVDSLPLLPIVTLPAPAVPFAPPAPVTPPAVAALTAAVASPHWVTPPASVAPPTPIAPITAVAPPTAIAPPLQLSLLLLLPFLLFPCCHGFHPCFGDVVDELKTDAHYMTEPEEFVYDCITYMRSLKFVDAATSHSRANKKWSKSQGRIVYKMFIYFKDQIWAQSALENIHAIAKARNYLGVEFITLPNVDYAGIGCKAMDLHYASVVYDRARSLEERDALLTVAPSIHINSAQMGPQFLEHDLHPLPPNYCLVMYTKWPHVPSPLTILRCVLPSKSRMKATTLSVSGFDGL